MISVRNFSYESMVESLSQKTDLAKDDWLARTYRFFLRADGNAENAKADFLAFLQHGRMPERILLFARHCVEDDGSGAPNEPRLAKSHHKPNKILGRAIISQKITTADPINPLAPKMSTRMVQCPAQREITLARVPVPRLHAVVIERRLEPLDLGKEGTLVAHIFDVLRAWESGQIVCPLEIGQQRPAVTLPLPREIIHLKTTSATTGAQRLVAFTAEELAADACNIVDTMGLRPDWSNLGLISLSHSYGFSNLVLPLLLHGIPLLLLDSPLPESVRQAGLPGARRPGHGERGWVG